MRKVCEINKRECPPNVEKLLKPPSDQEPADAGCISLFGNAYLRLITICFPCIWFTINLVYYGLILNMNSFGGNVYLNSVSSSPFSSQLLYFVCLLPAHQIYCTRAPLIIIYVASGKSSYFRAQRVFVSGDMASMRARAHHSN